MRKKQRQFGVTLTEVLVVVAVMAILLGISVPTAQHLMDSFESSTGVRYLINAALSNARAIAVRNQAYAGVRFQEAADGHTYMIFIVHDPDPSPEGTGLANGFRAVEGRKPMRLPEGVSVNKCSVIFSPAGKLTTHLVWVRNKDGVTDETSNDTIFNTPIKVDGGVAMFVQDGGNSSSVRHITIVQKGKYDSDTSTSTEYISPYTGELVMEYREDSL
jgi:prepilin-type N-terminal cleavage/methylation domain-containing protein